MTKPKRPPDIAYYAQNYAHPIGAALTLGVYVPIIILLCEVTIYTAVIPLSDILEVLHAQTGQYLARKYQSLSQLKLHNIF